MSVIAKKLSGILKFLKYIFKEVFMFIFYFFKVKSIFSKNLYKYFFFNQLSKEDLEDICTKVEEGSWKETYETKIYYDDDNDFYTDDTCEENINSFIFEKKFAILNKSNLVFNKNFYLFIYKNNIFYNIFDMLYLFFLRNKYNIFNKKIIFRSFFRFEKFKNDGFFLESNNLKFFNSLKNTFYYGLISVYKSFRLFVIPIFIGFIVIYYSLVIRHLPFNKIIIFWIMIGMFSYWLISGFVFFIKKYQFSKFTTAISRFWKRSYILFWLIEFSLFIIYFYLTLNANQESFYMFDQSQIFKNHLFSWRSFLLKLIPLTLLLLLSYFLILSLKWNVLNKQTSLIFLITILLLYVVWVEFYQFFHIVNFYGNFIWLYEADEKIWSIELEPRKTRTVNHYVMLMSILKFWHIIFIIIFWVFFVLRGLEIGRIRYPLLSANFQNFLILYLFAWVNMYPWLKFVFRKFLDTPYYWFYINNRDFFYRIAIDDLKLFVSSILSYVTNIENFFLNDILSKQLFIYWNLEDSDFLYSYRKAFLKNFFLKIVS